MTAASNFEVFTSPSVLEAVYFDVFTDPQFSVNHCALEEREKGVVGCNVVR
jgi:hypothetical protein